MPNKFQRFPGKTKDEIALAQQAKAWADDQGVEIVEGWFRKDNEKTGAGNYIIEYKPGTEDPKPKK